MPRRSLAVLAVLLAVGLTHADSRKSKPVTVSPAGSGFTAVFPAKPSDSEKELASAAGSLTVRTHRVTYNDVVYAVTVTEYPEAFADLPVEKILDGVRDGMKGSDGKVFEEKIELDGVAGRWLRIEAGKKNAIRVKVFLNQRKLYQVMVSGPLAGVGGKDADDFLASFGWPK